MNNDVKQWIGEIQALRQQVAEAQSDRDAALDSAAHWSQLYNTEAQQRRAEAKVSQQMIETLKAEIQQLKADIVAKLNEAKDVSASVQGTEQLQSIGELKQKLLEVLIERDRTAIALKAEREAHDRTRQSLTTALGDTIDLLAKHRGTNPDELKATPPGREAINRASTDRANLPESPKNPSLQLPPTRPAPPRP
ncbi:hypothetical protein [Argonema galeatum]|uniref:hypothetical protein n=1 Tax=Argonema galeatum TaxID=2942762 RepID=UPI00201139AF|nr:hypothetical protein [Argonema galeatum]MCL1468971.1 hypothetical protein [Argonema galeatum A003/A1]